jgi:hypothetical protein
MPTSVLIYLILMGAVFIAWAFICFRALFGLKKIANQRRVEQNAGYFKSIGITNAIFLEFATKPEHRQRFRQVVIATLLLFAIILGGRFALPLPN